MGEGIGSWYDQLQNNGHSYNFNILNAPYCLGQQSTSASYMNPRSNYVSTNGIMPVYGSSGLPQATASECFEPRDWFHCLHRFRQAFTPVLNSASPYKSCGDPVASNTQNARKKYLVFDQSGDQTTLIFSSGISGPVDNMPSWRLKPSNGFSLYKENPESKNEANNPSRMFSHNGFNKQDYKTDVRSEMHEDTEELDALLYSNDEGDYSEDEEASTGHSPSTPDHKRVWFDKSRDEVSTSARPVKKQRVYDGDHGVPSLMDTASSLKCHRCFKHEDSAEISYGKNNNMLVESDSASADQRTKIEKIRKTISILESIISDGKGKDSIRVIDDTIHYLRSLRDKAEVLGLDGQ